MREHRTSIATAIILGLLAGAAQAQEPSQQDTSKQDTRLDIDTIDWSDVEVVEQSEASASASLAISIEALGYEAAGDISEPLTVTIVRVTGYVDKISHLSDGNTGLHLSNPAQGALPVMHVCDPVTGETPLDVLSTATYDLFEAALLSGDPVTVYSAVKPYEYMIDGSGYVEVEEKLCPVSFDVFDSLPAELAKNPDAGKELTFTVRVRPGRGRDVVSQRWKPGVRLRKLWPW